MNTDLQSLRHSQQGNPQSTKASGQSSYCKAHQASTDPDASPLSKDRFQRETSIRESGGIDRNITPRAISKELARRDLASRLNQQLAATSYTRASTPRETLRRDTNRTRRGDTIPRLLQEECQHHRRKRKRWSRSEFSGMASFRQAATIPLPFSAVEAPSQTGRQAAGHPGQTAASAAGTVPGLTTNNAQQVPQKTSDFASADRPEAKEVKEWIAGQEKVGTHALRFGSHSVARL